MDKPSEIARRLHDEILALPCPHYRADYVDVRQRALRAAAALVLKRLSEPIPDPAVQAAALAAYRAGDYQTSREFIAELTDRVSETKTARPFRSGLLF